jgi:hypothetical protein
MPWYTIIDKTTKHLLKDGSSFKPLDQSAGVLIWPDQQAALSHAAELVRATKDIYGVELNLDVMPLPLATLHHDDLPQP